MANGLFGGGDGTKEKPYLIEDAADLQAASLTASNNINACFKVVSDIDMTGKTFYPIGYNTFYSYMGDFDGGYCVISNLKITPAEYHVSFIGYCANNTIKNVILRNVEIEHVSNLTISVSLLVSSMSEGVIQDCDVQGKITLTQTGTYSYGNVGGFINALYSGKIERCYLDVTIDVSTYYNSTISAFVNYLFGEVEDCAVKAVINGTVYARGLFNSIDSYTGKITNVYSVTQANTVTAPNGSPGDFKSLGDLASWDVVDTSSYYFDKDFGGVSDSESFYRTTSEMKQQSTFIDWNFEDIWEIDEGNDYPRLRKSIKCTTFPLSTLKVNIIN